MTRDGPPEPLDRDLPAGRSVVEARPDLGGGAATPSFALPPDASPGLPAAPAPLAVGPRTFAWGQRTHVMGILNVTPDSFSGDGLLATGSADPIAAAVAQARQMAEEGADLLDIGGASSRPGHAPLPLEEEMARVVPVIRAVAAALPGMPISVDTTSPAVAAAAVDAGAHLLNDVWGVADDPAMVRVAAEHGVPIVLMHNRSEPRYRNLLPEVVADLWRAVERAVDAGVPWDRLIVDPGFGFGKTPDHNVALLAGLGSLRVLGRPILLGTSRKSTLGRLLDLPPDQRVEATAATSVLGIAAGAADIIRVHDVRENVRAARIADAVVRGWRPADWGEATR
ncbi:MAG: dihydropteroate synthase [Candidatus Limnocylindrales bacterium]